MGRTAVRDHNRLIPLLTKSTEPTSWVTVRANQESTTPSTGVIETVLVAQVNGTHSNLSTTLPLLVTNNPQSTSGNCQMANTWTSNCTTLLRLPMFSTMATPFKSTTIQE